MIIFALPVFGIEDLWVKLWTVEPETELYTLKLFNLYAFFKLPGDALTSASLITLKGCGKQGPAAIAALICYYFVGIPTAWVLAFNFDLKVYGLWLGLSIGAWVLGINYLIQIWRIDWPKVIKDALNELNKKME